MVSYDFERYPYVLYVDMGMAGIKVISQHAQLCTARAKRAKLIAGVYGKCPNNVKIWKWQSDARSLCGYTAMDIT